MIWTGRGGEEELCVRYVLLQTGDESCILFLSLIYFSISFASLRYLSTMVSEVGKGRTDWLVEMAHEDMKGVSC
ncbi:hypothetical protein L873DRAFT_734622 [Choiromyces venosus 120613-1]|uniref:Uncharacterized protein n=1 Tax=Choiromyces venosus 120613-1 TaxID=1336337 RepID=A0A3N4IXR6_9PEZI|nr:hypothetical protein L873DRAFT_734622 [Choiromyces venosus 120613-1]